MDRKVKMRKKVIKREDTKMRVRIRKERKKERKKIDKNEREKTGKRQK